jgi:hypothetical protein
VCVSRKKQKEKKRKEKKRKEKKRKNKLTWNSDLLTRLNLLRLNFAEEMSETILVMDQCEASESRKAPAAF